MNSCAFHLTFRDALQKYFLPNNFQEIPVTKPLETEQQRLHTGFDVDIKFLEGASTELLFTQNEVSCSALKEEIVAGENPYNFQ